MKKRKQKKKDKPLSSAARIRLCKREAAPFFASRALRVTAVSVLMLFLLSLYGTSFLTREIIRILQMLPWLARPLSVIPAWLLSLVLSELFTLLFLFPLLLGMNGYLYLQTHGDPAPDRALLLFYTDKDLRLFSVFLYFRALLSLGLFTGALWLLKEATLFVSAGLPAARAVLVLFLAFVGVALLSVFFFADMLSLYPAVGEAVEARTDRFRRILGRAGKRMRTNRLLLLRLFLSYPLRLLLILLSGGILAPFLLPRILLAASLLETSFGKEPPIGQNESEAAA